MRRRYAAEAGEEEGPETKESSADGEEEETPTTRDVGTTEARRRLQSVNLHTDFPPVRCSCVSNRRDAAAR
jgi:hypothetical protein